METLLVASNPKPEDYPDELTAYLKVLLDVIKKNAIPSKKRNLLTKVFPRLTQPFNAAVDKFLRLNLNAFRPISLIGIGDWGHVWKCRFGSMSVALKRLKTTNLHPVMVYAELDILRELQHPRIVKLHGAFFDGRPWLVMEYCVGDLYSYLPNELGDRNIVRFFCQLAQGLDFIHSKNIIHRDLKPSNFLISSQNNCKIGDMGSAVRIPEGLHNVVDKTWGGTVECQDVEVLINYTYSKSSDVFALGVSWFEISTCTSLLETESEILRSSFKHNLKTKRKFYADAIKMGRIKETRLTRKDQKIPVKKGKLYVREPIMERIRKSKFEPILKDMICLDATKRLAASQLPNSPFLLGLLKSEGVDCLDHDETKSMPDKFDTGLTRQAVLGFPKSEPNSISVWAILCSGMYYDSGFGIEKPKSPVTQILPEITIKGQKNSPKPPSLKRKREEINDTFLVGRDGASVFNKIYLEEELGISCKLCEKTFMNRFRYAQHLHVHKKYVCWGCAMYGTNCQETCNAHMKNCAKERLNFMY